MRDKDEIDRADQIDKGTGRVRDPKRRAPQGTDHILSRQLRRPRNTRVIRAEGVEPMRVGRCDEWFAETFGDFDRAAIRIEKAAPEMAELDGIEAIDFFDEFLADRSSKNIERMRRDR